MILYDIFGYSPLILQGADLLTTAVVGRGYEYAAFMPDFSDGEPAPMEIWPDDNPEKTSALDGFIDGPGEMQRMLRRMERIKATLSEKYPNIRGWSLVGYCWGGFVRPPPRMPSVLLTSARSPLLRSGRELQGCRTAPPKVCHHGAGHGHFYPSAGAPIQG